MKRGDFYDRSSSGSHLGGRKVYDLSAPGAQGKRTPWEFVGGKVEPCETKGQARIRLWKETVEVLVSG